MLLLNRSDGVAKSDVHCSIMGETSIGNGRLGNNLCLVCGRRGGNTVVVTSSHSFVTASGTALGEFLNKIVGEEPCYSVSEVVCKQCYVLLDRLDTHQAKATEIKTHITTRYKDTKLELLGCRQNMSEMITTSLANVNQLQNGTILNVNNELSITVVHETLPKRRENWRPQDGTSICEQTDPTYKLNCSSGPTCLNNSSFQIKRKHLMDLNSKKRPPLTEKKPKVHPVMKVKRSPIPFINRSNKSNNNNNISYSTAIKNLCSLIESTKREVEIRNQKDSQFSGFNDYIVTRPHDDGKEQVNDSEGEEVYSNNYSSSEEEQQERYCKYNGLDKPWISKSNIASFSETSLTDVHKRRYIKESVTREPNHTVSIMPVRSIDCISPAAINNTSNTIHNNSTTTTTTTAAAVSTIPTTDDAQSESQQISPISSPHQEYSSKDKYTDIDRTEAEAAILDNPLATSLLQSFLSSSLWFSSVDDKTFSVNAVKDGQLDGMPSDDVTRECLALAAGSTKDKKKRQELKNTGQSYVNTKGKLVEAKRVWPQDCTRCPLKCNGRICEGDRQSIFAEFWGLADYNLQREYLAAHMQREERLGPSGLTRTVVSYYITHNNKKMQVCRQFFLKSLDISEKASRIVLEKKLRGELGNDRQILKKVVTKTESEEEDVKNEVAT